MYNKINIMKEITNVIDKNAIKGKKLEDFKQELFDEIEQIFKHKVVIDKRISESAKQI